MVYLVGAGPGNPGLITVKGLELIKRCDALIYDRLGTNEILENVSAQCKKIYVGKKPGEHYKKQEEINEILVDTAKKYNTVVRLKGGDPFVFGRGGEEADILLENSIPFQIIPGITSAISVPELMGIPVTHRKTSRSFHVYTGHTKESEDSFDYIKKQSGTSVFLMGISNLDKIVDKLLTEGYSASTPVAIISNGTLPGEKMVKGSLNNINKLVKDEKLSSPAVIIVGDTTEFNFISKDISSLAKIKIGVVGTKALREKMRYQIEEKGAQLFSLVSMEVKKTEYYNEIETELNNISKYTYLVFTSANSIRLFFEKAKNIHFDFRRFAGIKFAVVGSGTLEALREYGFEADYVPSVYTTKDLAIGLSTILNDKDKLLIPRAYLGSEELPKVLNEKLIPHKILPIYDVKGEKTDNWQFLNDFDVITFASSSGVKAFVEILAKETDISLWETNRRKNGTLVGAIGRVTADSLIKYGIEPDIVPEQCDIENLILSIENYKKKEF